MCNEYKDLGSMNSWKEVPKEVKECREKKHTTWYEKLGRCYERKGCDICKYTYTVDSSD